MPKKISPQGFIEANTETGRMPVVSTNTANAKIDPHGYLYRSIKVDGLEGLVPIVQQLEDPQTTDTPTLQQVTEKGNRTDSTITAANATLDSELATLGQVKKGFATYDQGAAADKSLKLIDELRIGIRNFVLNTSDTPKEGNNFCLPTSKEFRKNIKVGDFVTFGAQVENMVEPTSMTIYLQSTSLGDNAISQMAYSSNQGYLHKTFRLTQQHIDYLSKPENILTHVVYSGTGKLKVSKQFLYLSSHLIDYVPAVEDIVAKLTSSASVEIGTWTPACIGATSGKRAAIAINNACYTKVGSLANVSCSLTITDASPFTGTEEVYIAGVPFTPARSTAVPATLAIVGSTSATSFSAIFSQNKIRIRTSNGETLAASNLATGATIAINLNIHL